MDFEFFENLRYRDDMIRKDKDGIAIIEKLNSIINGDKVKQRFGLCVLYYVLKKCDSDLFEEHATVWMRFIMKLITTIPSEQLLHLCYSSLELLIEFSREIDRLSREVSTKAIDPLLALLVGPSIPVSPSKLNMLRCLILHYPAACGHYRSNIEKLIINAIESDDRLVYLSGCKLYTLIASCGTAGEKKNRLAENWLNQFYHVTNSIIYYISKMGSITLSNCDDLPANFHPSKVVPFSDVSEKLEISSSKISSRMERLLCMLEHMISTAMSFEVQVPLLRLFKVFCELSNALHEELKDFKDFEVTITRLTDSLLRCLYVAIRQFKTSLLIFCNQITEILVSILHLKCFNKRVNVYQCFIEMLRNWNILSTHSLDVFLSNIFNDIMIKENLSSCENNKKETAATLKEDILSSSKRKSIKQEDIIKNQNAHVALRLLERILISNGPLLSEELLNCILSNISDILVNLYRKTVFSSPYLCEDNRFLLFKVLRCFLFLHHGSVHIPSAVIVSHFSNGLKDSSDKVKNYCHDNLLHYDSVMHSIDFGFCSNSTGSFQKAVKPLSQQEKRKSEEFLTNDASRHIRSPLKEDCVQTTRSPSQILSTSDSTKDIKVKDFPRHSSAETFVSNLSPGKPVLHAIHPSSNITPVLGNNVAPSRHIDKPVSNTIMTTKSPSPKVPEKISRFCNSADQVLTKSAEVTPLPHRPYSESSAIVSGRNNSPKINNSPHMKMNFNDVPSSSTPVIGPFNNSNNAIHIDDGSPSKECNDSGHTVYEDYEEDEEDDIYDDGGPVVISDSSEDDVACTKSINKFNAKSVTGSNNGNLGNVEPQENLYNPRMAKRMKVSNTGNKLQYNENDMEYILSTFNEDSSADMIM